MMDASPTGRTPGVADAALHATSLPVRTQLLVTAEDWPQRPALLTAIKERLAAEPQRASWYPGSDQKLAAFKRRFPQVGLCRLCPLVSGRWPRPPARPPVGWVA